MSLDMIMGPFSELINAQYSRRKRTGEDMSGLNIAQIGIDKGNRWIILNKEIVGDKPTVS